VFALWYTLLLLYNMPYHGLLHSPSMNLLSHAPVATGHVILKIKFNKGPRVAPEPSREILLRAPGTTLGEPLGVRFGGSLMGPLIELYF